MKQIRCILLFLLFPALVFPSENKEFTLAEIIDIGLKNNPLILAKKKEVEAKKASYQASKLFSNPELSYHKGRAKSYDNSIKRNTDGLSLSQNIENPVKRHHRIQMYKNDWQATEHFFLFSKLEVIYEIKNIYYKILLLDNRKELAQKTLNSIKSIYHLIVKRAELGEVKELEAIKLNVEILKAQNDLNTTITEMKLARENLNKFLGNLLPSDFSIQGELDYRPLIIEEKSLLQKSDISHPLIKGKEEELEYAKSQINYIKWQRVPDPKLSGFIHDDLHGQNKGIGISLEIPLWNFKSKEIAQAEQLFLKQNEELKAMKMEISTEVKTKLSQLRLSEQAIKLFRQGLLKQAEESLKISEVSYRQGEISLIDYLDSQRTYYSILKDYQDSLYRWNANKASLEKAIGEELR